MRIFIASQEGVMKRILLSTIVSIALLGTSIAIGLHFKQDDSTANRAQSKQLWTCGMHPQIVQDHPGPCPICGMPLIPLVTQLPKGELLHTDGVVIDPTVVQNMGVRTAMVMRGPLTKIVRVLGVLEAPETAQYDVNVRVNGWIEKLYADQEGVHVHRGQPLLDFSSPDLLVLEQKLIVASAWPTWGNSKEVRDARRQLELAGVADQDIDAIVAARKPPRTVPLRSPADGVIQDKTVLEGSAVGPGMRLMRIEDHSTLWLQAQIFERQSSLIKVGQTAQAMFDSAPGKIFSGRVDLVYPHVDRQSRTMMVRITLDNPSDNLKPGMYAQVGIVTTPIEDALLAPREAIIDTGTRQIAFTAQPQGHFEPTDVTLGLSGDDDRVQILSGLKEGDTVVTSGQFLLEATSRTNESLQKMRQGSLAN
jgi:multidrug efflux pump subunit AcrA (membrane-fusion protein)